MREGSRVVVVLIAALVVALVFPPNIIVFSIKVVLYVVFFPNRLLN